MTLDRRSLLVGLAGAALAGPALARSTGVLDRLGLADPDKATDAFVRMRCNLPGQWGTWVYRGDLLVRPQGQLAQSVCRIEGISFNRAVRRPDGGWDYELEEVGYYCANDTGRPADRIVNPFTGATVSVRHYRSPQKLTFADRVVRPNQELPPGISYRGVITAPVEIGENVFASEDLYVSSPARPATADRPARAARIQTSLAMFQVRGRDLLRPGWVPSTNHYSTMNDIIEWLDMASMPGVQNMRLVMTKGQDLSRAPAWLLERARADHPTFFEGRPA